MKHLDALFFLLFLLFLVVGSPAWAQSSPGLALGQVPSAAQWNSYFSAKQDLLSFTPFGPSGTITPGDCAEFASATTISDAGAACGSGGGGVSSFNTRTGTVALTSGDVTTALTFTPFAPSGSITTGHCAEFASATTIEDAGAACGSGGGGSGVSTFNTRTGDVTLSSSDITTALTFTPAASGANSDITKLTGLTTALGAAYGGIGVASPTGYLYGNGSSAATASTTIPGSAISGDISGDAANISGTYAGTVSSSQITTGLGFTPFAASGAITPGHCPQFASSTTLSDSGAPCGGGGGGVASNPFTSALTTNVTMSSSNTFYGGPYLTLPSGLTGQTWFVSASVTIISSTALNITCGLYSGNTPIASGPGSAKDQVITLSAQVTSPATSLNIACESSGTTSYFAANYTGLGMDSVISAQRIN